VIGFNYIRSTTRSRTPLVGVTNRTLQFQTALSIFAIVVSYTQCGL